jgi:hypothetical protein
MKQILKKIGIILLIAFVIIQFFKPARNINTTPDAVKNDISAVMHVPADVQLILQTSCYDCHSNNSKYPWYANVQPVAWWLNHHIEEGKHEINFNEFATYRIRRQYRKMQEIVEQVQEGEMPMSSYTLIHGDATLNEAQKSSVINWAKATIDSMKAKYPTDSLVKK